MKAYEPIRGGATVQDLVEWMKERQRIFRAREAGEPKPWTDDPAMREWSFCNVYRARDRGSQVLYRMLQTMREEGCEEVELIIMIAVYRAFNQKLNEVVLMDWWRQCSRYDGRWLITDWGELHKMLSRRQAGGVKIFSDAYIISPRGQARPKLDIYIDLLKGIYWKDLIGVRDMKQTFEVLTRDGLGPFEAHEIVQDLRLCVGERSDWDGMSWYHLGPGAARGMIWLNWTKGAFRDLFNYVDKMWTEEWRDSEYPFELHTLEFVLCELDSYMRVRHGGVKRKKYAGE